MLELIKVDSMIAVSDGDNIEYFLTEDEALEYIKNNS